jgi:predicted nucleotide-binding protein
MSITAFMRLVHLGRDLVGQVEKYRGVDLAHIPEADRMASAEASGWFDAAETLIKDSFGDDSRESKEWKALQNQLDEQGSREFARDIWDERQSLIRRFHKSMGLLTKFAALVDTPDPKHADRRANSMPDAKSVFVVHGRNEKVRRSMFQFLQALKLNPLEWDELIAASGKGAPSIPEVIEKGFDIAQAVVVLLTGDDEAKLRDDLLKPDDPEHEKNLTPQPRPNVLFEAGMALARHPERTILVQIGKSRPFSDISGLHVVRFDGTPEKREVLRKRLSTTGCLVSGGTDWLTAGEF